MMKAVIHDARFSITGEGLSYALEKEDDPQWEAFRKTMHFLGSIGFYVGEDKEIKKRYPNWNMTHRAGGFGDLRFKASYRLNSFEIQFYQDVCNENPYGGFYDFDKYEKMPYLIQKRYDWTQEKLLKYFEKCGYSVEFLRKAYRGADFIINDYIDSWYHPQKEWFSLEDVDGQTVCGRDGMDRDGNVLRNGETKYFRDWNGYLMRGKVYYNTSNMWWVLMEDGQVRNKASFELFDLKETDFRGRRKAHCPPKEYTERKRQLSLCSVKELKNELRRRRKCGGKE